jgi:hypothetical protein
MDRRWMFPPMRSRFSETKSVHRTHFRLRASARKRVGCRSIRSRMTPAVVRPPFAGQQPESEEARAAEAEEFRVQREACEAANTGSD